MSLINNTPFKLVPLSSQVSPPAHSMTVIVKGTFMLRDGGVCTLADEQLDFAPDEPYLDDIGRSLAWASDLAPFKPHTDFYLHGAFHQPDGQPAPGGTASIELGPLKKSLVIHGPRRATIRDGVWIIGEATPVVSVPMRWEYSFGGVSHAANPFGRGIDPVAGQDGETMVDLPLIEHPDYPVRRPTDRPPPANFAPVPVLFEERLRKRGTYDQRWNLFRAPLPPIDFDPSYHNAAPGDQQAGNYPCGNELLVLRHLHPRIPELRTRLPGLRPRVGILRIKTDVPKNPAKIAGWNKWDVSAHEVVMNIDTVVALPQDDRIVLVWRGVQPMRQPNLTPELAWLQCELDEPGRPPLDFAEIEARMRNSYRESMPPSHEEVDREIAALLNHAKGRLKEVELPADLRTFVEKESDPRLLFERLLGHIDAELSLTKKNLGLPE